MSACESAVYVASSNTSSSAIGASFATYSACSNTNCVAPATTVNCSGNPSNTVTMPSAPIDARAGTDTRS